MTGLRERFGSTPGLRSRFSAAVPVEDQWVEVGIFLVNTRTGERKLNNRNGGLPSIDTPTMAAPSPRPAGLARIPDPVEQPRSSHGDPFLYDDSTRYAGIVDRVTGQPRQRPGLPTPAATTDNLYEEPGFVEAGVNAWDRGVAGMAGTFGAFGEMVGRGMQPDPDPADRMSPAQRAALEKARQLYGVGGLPPSAMGMATHATGIGLQREGQEIQSRTEREQQAIPRPEYARDFWSGMRTDPFKTAAIGALENLPQLVTTIGTAAAGGPLAGGAMAGIQEAGGAYQETEGLPEEERRQIAGWVGATNMFLEYLPAGKLLKTLKGGDSVAAKGVMRLAMEQAAAEGGTESVQELNQILSQLFMSAHSQNISVDELGKRVAEAGFTGALLGLAGGGTGASVASVPRPLGLRGRFGMSEPMAEDGEAGQPPSYAPLDEDGVPRFGWKEALRQGASFPPDLDPWIASQGVDPDVLTHREKLDHYGQMVAQEKAAHATWLEEGPPAPEPIPELTRERWEELRAMNATRDAKGDLGDYDLATRNSGLTPQVPTWASSVDEAVAGWADHLAGKLAQEPNAPYVQIDPLEVPFELVNLPITRWSNTPLPLTERIKDRVEKVREGDIGLFEYDPRRRGEFYLIGEQVAYMDSDLLPGEGGATPSAELFTPRNPLILARGKAFDYSASGDNKLIQRAEEGGHDAIVIFNRDNDLGHVELVKTGLAQVGQPRRAELYDDRQRLIDSQTDDLGLDDMGMQPWQGLLDRSIEPPRQPVPPSPLATGLWERFQSRRPTALTAPFEQRLAAAAYDRGLVRTQEELSALLEQAPQFAPAAAGRVATDAAIRDALEALRSRPAEAAAAPVAEALAPEAPPLPPQPSVPGKPSEAGFLRIRSEPPPPDIPGRDAMEPFIGDPNLPPMTMTERFDALRNGARSFYAEMVNLDAPVERLGKREGAPSGMKRDVELQVQRVRGAGDIAGNMAESRNDVESMWSIWNGAEDSYHDWRGIGAAEREMELIERAEAGDEIEIDQDAATVARDYLDNVVPQLRAQNPRLDRLITETRRWTRDNNIEPLVEAGILSRAQADEILSKNQVHLPFNRVQRAVEAMAAGTQDEVARAKIHRITAGLSEADKIREPMESILQRAHHVRTIVEQQKLRNLLVDYVQQAPDIFPEIKPAETKAMPVAVVDDKTIFRRKRTKTKKTEAFPYWKDGEMQVWEGPEDVMNVVNFLGPRELEGGLKWIHSILSVPGQMLRAGVTSTLEFGAYRNPLFDQYEAFTNSKAGFVWGIDTVRGLFHVVGKTKLWDDAMRAGAGNSVLVAIDRPETVTRISSIMQGQGLAGSIRSAMDAYRDAIFPLSGEVFGIPAGTPFGRSPGKRGFAPSQVALAPLQAVSQVMEGPTRMGGYLAAEKPMPWNRAVRSVENMLVPASQRVGMGPLGPELAMEEYRSNTLDFLRGGRTGKLLNSVKAFLNPEIQGWDKLGRNLKYRPGPTLLKMFASYTIPALIHWSLNHDDEEYQREPEWKKMLFFRLPLPNGTSVPIPRGRGLGAMVFGYMIEKVLDHAAETDPDAARDVVAALVDNTPAHYAVDVRRSGGTMPSLDSVPTAAEPWVEIATNYDTFRDAPVEPRGQTSKLSEDRFSASTSPTLRKMSEFTPFSPIQVQHLVRGTFGGVGQYATDAADQFVGSDFQELPPDNQLPAPLDWAPTDAPLLKGLVSREPAGFSSRPVQDFYAILERATQARNSFKAADEAGRYERADEIVAEHPEMDWAEDLERASKELGEIRKEWNEIRALPPDAATPEEIREWLHDLDVEATLVAEDALRSVGLMK